MNHYLTIRSLIIGNLLAMVTAMSATYLALRMNSFYWASILTSLMSVLLLNVCAKLSHKHTDVHEVNLTQTMASVGGILSAGICFTLPALFFLDKELFSRMTANLLDFALLLFFIGLAGGIGGVLLSAKLRYRLIEMEQLPFPTGIAAADTIKATVSDRRQINYLLIPFVLVSIFTGIRDGIVDKFKGLIPMFIGTNINGFNLQLGLIPMTIGGGYLIGFKTAMTWLAGCLVSNWLFQPLVSRIIDDVDTDIYLNYLLPAGVGIVIGSGLVLIAKTVFSMINTFHRQSPGISTRHKAGRFSFTLILLIVSLFLSLIVKIPVFAAIIAVIGLWFMTHLAARMSGETNIDPMEILAVTVVIVINLFYHLPLFKSIVIAAVIAVAVGVAADLLFDLKAGHILGTSAALLTRAQLIGVFSSSAVVGISLVSLLRAFELGSPDLFALQSQIVAYMLGSINWTLLVSGLFVGGVITLIGHSGLAFGVGFFIPMFFSTGFAIGGFLKYIIDKKAASKDELMRLAAAGLIGGEGVSGTLVAFYKMLF